jgi:uncharacterized protein YcfL
MQYKEGIMKKVRWMAVIGLSGIAALLVGGCSTTAGVQAGASSYTEQSYLIVDNPRLADQVTVSQVSHDMVGEIMRGHATLKSNRGRTLRLKYRFSWYDGNGMELDSTGKPYRDLILEGKDAVPVTSMAPSPHAREFKIRIREI